MQDGPLKKNEKKNTWQNPDVLYNEKQGEATL